MKVKLTCTYARKAGQQLGEYGDVLESPKHATADELKGLVAMGSATEIEPPKKSERDL